MTLGKGIGGGFPLSAMLAREDLDIFAPGDQGGTYTGQPLAMAAGLAVLNEILEKNIPAHVEKMGEKIQNRLADLCTTHAITNVRGMGLLIAFDLERTSGTDLVSACLKDGLIINAPKPKSVRLMPPLVVTESEIDRFFDIMIPHLPRR